MDVVRFKLFDKFLHDKQKMTKIEVGGIVRIFLMNWWSCRQRSGMPKGYTGFRSVSDMNGEMADGI